MASLNETKIGSFPVTTKKGMMPNKGKANSSQAPARRRLKPSFRFDNPICERGVLPRNVMIMQVMKMLRYQASFMIDSSTPKRKNAMPTGVNANGGTKIEHKTFFSKPSGTFISKIAQIEQVESTDKTYVRTLEASDRENEWLE